MARRNGVAMGDDSLFTMKIRHGGIMKHTPKREYLGGAVDYFDLVDADQTSMLDVWGFAEELGYNDHSTLKFWVKYRKNFNTQCKQIFTDADVFDMRKYIPKNFEIEIFIEHLISEGVRGMEENQDSGGDKLSDQDESSEDDDVFYESDFDMEEDDKLFESFVDPDVEFAGLETGKSVANEFITDEMFDKMQNEHGDADCVGSDDDFVSTYGSEDESDRVHYPKFNPKTDHKNPELKLGMIFSSKEEAKFAIQSHCFRRGMMVKFVKNDKIRLRAVCKNDGCSWFTYLSKMQNDSSWQIKSYNSVHSKCSWNYNNTSLKSSWIGKTFLKKFKENPKLGTNEFRNELCTTLKASVSKSVAYRARKRALEMIQGSMEEQFTKIWDYCLEFERTNPGSTVRVKLTDENRFLRMYMCFNACKTGFKNGCRPLIGVDGCFLKGNHGGQLLSAVGLDANNNIYPIAYAIVEVENKDSWMWFLSLLDIDIGFEDQFRWTFMSDKQKGLIPAFEALLPNVENRFCVRHLHSNMKRDGFTGMAIKTALWAAAKATRIEEFERRMQDLKNIDEGAYLWLIKKPPQNWTRSHFSPYPRCDILLNNMCECFNSFILDARDKPIISLLETIRNLIMTRMQINREKAAKWEGPLCPKIKQILMKNMKEAGECIPRKSDEWHFQIVGPFDQHTVNLLDKKCSCRKWDLSGIPCKHACSAIWCRNEEPEAYVHPCYTVESYLRAYENPIFGFNGPDLWPKSQLVPPLPPQYSEKVGRPQRIRRREPDEPPAATSNPFRLTGVKRVNKCRICGETSHNSKTCKKRQFSQVEHGHDQQESRSKTARATTGQRAAFGPRAATGSRDEVGSASNLHDFVSTQASVSTKSPIQQQNNSTRSKLQVRRPQVQKKANMKRNTGAIMGSFQASKSSPFINAPMIVKGGMNFITVSNLRSSLTNVTNPTSSQNASSRIPMSTQPTSNPSPSQPASNPIPTQHVSKSASILSAFKTDYKK